MVTECPNDPSQYEYLDEEERTGPYTSVNSPEPNCSYQGCLGDSSCIVNQIERPWKGNPDPVDDKPDVVAPVIYPTENGDGQIDFSVGSSYAAPVLAGALGSVFSEVNDVGIIIPSPKDVRKEIIRQSATIDEGTMKKPDITRTMKELTST